MTRSPNKLRVALVEAPAVDIRMEGERVLDDFTLHHTKYPQLVLAENLRRTPGLDVEVTFVDLKGGGQPETVHYGNIDYCGERLELWRIGPPFENAAGNLFEAEIVGFSANFTFERSVLIQTIAALKASKSPPLVVVGGHDATADPAYYLERGADLCVLGEGETAIQEIALAVANGDTPIIQGTASLQGGRVRRDSRRRAHKYDEISFPGQELLHTTDFYESPDGPLPKGVSARITSLEASRGCPEACSFCDISFIVGRYRPVPLGMLIERVHTIKAAGIKTIQVIDDNLLYRTLPQYGGDAGRQAILDLFRLLYEEGFAWEFFNGFQLGLFENNNVVDVELIQTLYRNASDGENFAGCFRSYVPLDKVTAQEMSRLRKLKPLPVARAVVTAIAECGVPSLALGFVIGNTRETRSTLDETIMRAEEFSSLVSQASRGRTTPYVLPLCSVPLPGTPDFRHFQDNIVYPVHQYPELYNVVTSVLRNDDFSPLEITRQRQHMKDTLNRGVSPLPQSFQ